jgi:hypothetical protein
MAKWRYASTISNFDLLMDVSGQIHATRLYPGEKSSKPIGFRDPGTEDNFLPLSGMELRSPGQSLR